MNPSKNGFGDALTTGTGNTSQTVNATLEFIERKQPSCVVLENVAAFAYLFNSDRKSNKKSGQRSNNFHLLVKRLSRIYSVNVINTNACQSGFPQSRHRLYFVRVKKTSETESRASGDTDPSFDNFQAKWWTQGSSTGFPVERFLLNDDDPVVVAAVKEMCWDVRTRS